MSRLSNSDIQTFIAAEAITALQAVVINSAGKVALADGTTGEQADGIAQRTADAGDAVEVVIFGRTKALAGATLTAGTHSLLMVETATARLIPWANGAGTEYSVARVIFNQNVTSYADGDEIEVIFTGASQFA
ncbi:MAG: hypothetical protein ACO39X_06235 [Candidatus Nanopelagicaceae bacterium]|jgi:hypothetical protein